MSESVRVLIDNNALESIAQIRDHDKLSTLRRCVREATIQVVPSLELIQELICLVEVTGGTEILKKRAKLLLELGIMRSPFLACNAVTLVAELRDLAPSDPFSSEEDRCKYRSLVMDWANGVTPAWAREYARELRLEKSRRLKELQKQRADVQPRIAAIHSPQKSRSMKELWEDGGVARRQLGFLERQCQAAGLEHPERRARLAIEYSPALPYIHAALRTAVAREYFHHYWGHDGALGRKNHEGDRGDDFMLIHMQSADWMITNDKDLRQHLVGLVYEGAKLALSSEEFLDKLERLH